ncbi:hypothetical protein GCM10007981_04280 [Thermocladium modestius]|uniref:Uncharacterized protein n=1 Tax=Thermocladium modestius TaxID=62609 RepID=A0A830GUA9_9CREN|nr:hypothetical protein GCM10007981_04280 [Thermocladium modestius]
MEGYPYCLLNWHRPTLEYSPKRAALAVFEYQCQLIFIEALKLDNVWMINPPENLDLPIDNISVGEDGWALDAIKHCEVNLPGQLHDMAGAVVICAEHRHGEAALAKKASTFEGSNVKPPRKRGRFGWL